MSTPTATEEVHVEEMKQQDPTAVPQEDQDGTAAVETGVGGGEAKAAIPDDLSSNDRVLAEFQYDIDDEVKTHIYHNEQVEKFLLALQTIVITESIQIGPKIMFYIVCLLFYLPVAYSIVSVTVVDFPKQLFFDGCEHINKTTGAITTYKIPECVTCCNNRSFIYTDLIPKPDEAQTISIATIIVAAVSGALAGPAYARLQLGENLALHMLSYGVIIKSPKTCGQYLPVVFFALCFAVVASLNTYYSSLLSIAFSRGKVTLGFGDICDVNSTMAGLNLTATFNEGNPSLAGSSLPQTDFDFAKEFIIIFALFIPALSKMYAAASTTFTTIGLEELVTDNENSSATFEFMHYEVDEDDLYAAIDALAQRIDDSETCTRMLRRLFVCDFDMGHPMDVYFGFTDGGQHSWGRSSEQVQHVITTLKRQNKLNDYRPKDKAV